MFKQLDWKAEAFQSTLRGESRAKRERALFDIEAYHWIDLVLLFQKICLTCGVVHGRGYNVLLLWRTVRQLWTDRTMRRVRCSPSGQHHYF